MLGREVGSKYGQYEDPFPSFKPFTKKGKHEMPFEREEKNESIPPDCITRRRTRTISTNSKCLVFKYSDHVATKRYRIFGQISRKTTIKWSTVGKNFLRPIQEITTTGCIRLSDRKHF